MLSLHCCVWVSLGAASRGYSLAAVHKLLIAEAPLVAEHRLSDMQASQLAAPRLSSCGTRHVAPWHVGTSFTRDRTGICCIARWILNHWTTREALTAFLITRKSPFDLSQNHKLLTTVLLTLGSQVGSGQSLAKRHFQRPKATNSGLERQELELLSLERLYSGW